MRRCVYCFKTLVLVPVAVRVKACAECGCQYSRELFVSIDDARWEEILSSPRYDIERISGDPPSVVVTDLSPV